MGDHPAGPVRKKLYIETVGCQMNLLDSELVVARMRDQGYDLTDDIESGRRDPLQHLLGPPARRGQDLQRAGSDQARSRNASRKWPSASWAAWPRRTRMRSSAAPPMWTSSSARASSAGWRELLAKATTKTRPQIAVSRARNRGSLEPITASFENYDADREPAMRPNPFQAFIRVMMGCDKFCTYCIVPSVRGPEQSRPPAAILAEACLLADQGVKEITLLGQTVNSYQFPGTRRPPLPALRPAGRIHDIAGIERIKFITNFPNDMTDDLLQAVRDLPKVARYLHVPAQSGCDEILKRMKRMYTVAFL